MGVEYDDVIVCGEVVDDCSVFVVEVGYLYGVLGDLRCIFFD